MDKIQDDNLVRKTGKVPEYWMLDEEITLSDGTKVKLKPQDQLDAIQAVRSGASDFTVRKNEDETKTKYDLEIYETKPEADKSELSVESHGHSSIEEAEQTAKEWIAEFKKE